MLKKDLRLQRTCIMLQLLRELVRHDSERLEISIASIRALSFDVLKGIWSCHYVRIIFFIQLSLFTLLLDAAKMIQWVLNRTMCTHRGLFS